MENYGFQRYEWQQNVVDLSLLDGDAINFSVLIRILQGTCEKIFTDGERIIICHSLKPYPVWVWTANDLTQEELSRIGDCLRNEFPAEEGFLYNISYELFDQLTSLGGEFEKLRIHVNLLSYRCDHLRTLSKRPDGQMIVAKLEQAEELAQMMHDMEFEAMGQDHRLEECIKAAKEKIANEELYVWLNASDLPVAIASRRPGKPYMCVAHVFTKPEERRKGYAMALVHGVSERIMELSAIPILYTNADYAASNECYKKIGYEQVASLCTVGK